MGSFLDSHDTTGEKGKARMPVRALESWIRQSQGYSVEVSNANGIV
jgi:hypothetical protein